MSDQPQPKRPATDLPIFWIDDGGPGPFFQSRWEPDGSVVFLAPDGYRMEPEKVDAYIEWLQNQKAPKA